MRRGPPDRLGATWLPGDRCRFEVWAPRARRVDVRLEGRAVPLQAREGGLFEGVVEGVPVGARYLLSLDDGEPLPDPASGYQPDGPDGPSMVVDSDWPWRDAHWHGVAVEDLVLYELHVGTFSGFTGFAGVVPVLEALKGLGVTAIQLMPVAQAASRPGWGLDVTHPFAIETRFGGPDGFRRLVEACHEIGLAVGVDVVHGHLGAQPGRFAPFGPYFDERRRTIWGPSPNLDGPHSDEVRRYLVESAVRWVTDYHVDVLRVDAIDEVLDTSAQPFLGWLVEAVRDEAERVGRRVHVVASGDENDVRVVRPPPDGHGFDAQVSPDFAAALHALLSLDIEEEGPLRDFGRVEHLARAWRNGFTFEGQYSAHRRRRVGSLARSLPGYRFVVSAQDYKHIALRSGGQRIAARLGLAAARLAAGVTLLAPRLPLLFMGEEYGETAPFVAFADEESYRSSQLDHALRRAPGHAQLRELYAELLRLRRELPALRNYDPTRVESFANEARRLLVARRGIGEADVFMAWHFGAHPRDQILPLPPGRWRVRLDSEDPRWGGAGSRVPLQVESPGEVEVTMPGRSFLLFERARSS
jgi:maltooligosyltrehalose trehalohydrolase